MKDGDYTSCVEENKDGPPGPRSNKTMRKSRGDTNVCCVWSHAKCMFQGKIDWGPSLFFLQVVVASWGGGLVVVLMLVVGCEVWG